MKCKNCGALLHENDTFCRTCATPVSESCIEGEINLATSDFAKTNKPNSHVGIVDNIIDTSNIDNNYYNSTNQKDINNKDLLDKDPNNKVKATIINIGGLIVMLFIILILVILFIKVVSNL